MEDKKNTNSGQPELKRLMEENIKMTEEIGESVKKIRKYIAFQRVMSILYFLVITVPIILSIIYLPPLLKNFTEPYLDLIKSAEQSLMEKGN